MGSVCRTYEGEDFGGGDPAEAPLKTPILHGRIILELIFKKWGGGRGLD
jgi:hypothetical protein